LRIRLFFISTLLAVCIGCGLGKVRDGANIQLEGFYGAIAAGDFDGALAYFAPEFFEEEMSKEQCLEMLQDTQHALGSLTDFNVQGSRVVSDGYVRFHCDTAYTKLEAKEEIVFDKKEGMERHLIFDYRIKSNDGSYVVGFWVTEEDIEKVKKKLSEALKPE